MPRSFISIHALREEGDSSSVVLPPCAFQFLSTPSARRATSPSPALCTPSLNFYPRPPRGGRREQFKAMEARGIISIHALREEGDRRG